MSMCHYPIMHTCTETQCIISLIYTYIVYLPHRFSAYLLSQEIIQAGDVLTVSIVVVHV